MNVNIAQQTTNQTPNPPAPKACRTPKRRRRTVLKRIVDAPLKDIGGRLFEPDNSHLHEQRDSLLLKHYGELRDAVFNTYASCGWQDAESILARLSQRLHQFLHVPLEGFLEWASCYVGIQARRQRAFDSLLSDETNLAYARKGAWSILQTCADLGLDAETTILEIELDVLNWIHQNLTKLYTESPTKAKLSTRLYARGRFSALTWKNQRLREKKAYSDLGYIDRLAENYHPGKLAEGRQIHFPTEDENKYPVISLN